MIISIQKSPRINKRFRVAVKHRDGRIQNIDFGYLGATTYIDGASEQTRVNCLKRHMANATEKKLIDGLIPSPSLMSAKLLWGTSRDIQKNIASLNREWEIKKMQ
jgi:hypothetical protein